LVVPVEGRVAAEVVEVVAVAWAVGAVALAVAD
jgi:hypothetical protein